MNDISGYFSQQDEITLLKSEIKKLKAKVKSEQSMKYTFKTKVKELSDNILTRTWQEKNEAKVLHDRMIIKATKLMRVLSGLVLNGRIDLTNNEIADLCFVTPHSVVNYKSRLKNERI